MSLSVDPTLRSLNDCGCCEGVSIETPVQVYNRPGLTAIAYRVGTHTQFKQTLLARLSGSRQPALSKLTTRDDDDFSIALLDAWATVADVLTFYQERIANETYLRTATERLSVLELARLIGYELRPGVAASTYLAFTIEDAPGAFGQALSIGTIVQSASELPPPITVDIGTKVQSIPGPGEQAQTFETVEKIEARAEWNAMKPRQTFMQLPAFGDIHLYLAGILTNLKPGDPLLIVGREREEQVGSERWEIRRISAVEPDAKADRTLVHWDEPLGSVIPRVDPPTQGVKVYALRLRASIFGHNAPDWETLPVSLRVGETNPKGTPKVLKGAYADREKSWADAKFNSGTKIINLDAVYSQIVLNSWIVLATSNYAELYRVSGVSEESKSDFNITAKTTRLEISGENIGRFSPRNATVYAQSELLELTEMPIFDPLEGNAIPLDRLVYGLEEGRTLAVQGKRVRTRLADDATGLVLTSADGRESISLNPGDSLRALAPYEPTPDGRGKWRLQDANGFSGSITALPNQIKYESARESDEAVSEIVILEEATVDRQRTTLTLVSGLQNIYDRRSVTINANLALATHGETVQGSPGSDGEVLGGGDASQAFQRFTLRQPPLTYISASTPSGGQTTLEVRVNDLLWHEVPTFYGRGPEERIYVTYTDDDGKTTVMFGDGKTGARLPTGQENVKAKYRKGIGLPGLIKANQLTQLMTRPLGLKGVTNPLAPNGAADPENLDEARRNAPLTVLTLDRVVSLQDYEDFARSFSGIDKTLATWTWSGERRSVFVTVAGAKGAEVKADSELYKNLLKALRQFGDPTVPLIVESYQPCLFRLSAAVKVHPDYLPDKVLAAVEQKLRESFSFEARTFSQPVNLSEVIAVMQNVSGVIAVDINEFYRSDQPAKLNPRLEATIPRLDGGKAFAAELLMLDPRPLGLEVMR